MAKSGKALVLSGLLALAFGHWMSIGSWVHFSPSHQPVQISPRHSQDNCSWALQYPTQDSSEGTSYTIPLNPYGRGGSSSMKDTSTGVAAREDYPPHIPVVKTKHISEKDEPSNSMLPRAPVSNWIDPRDIKASLQASFKDSSDDDDASSFTHHLRPSNPPRALPLESNLSNNPDYSNVPGNSQDQTSHPRTPVTVGNSDTNNHGGQQYSGNKPPLISGSPIYGGKSDIKVKPDEEEEKLNQVHVQNAGAVSAFYKISCHLYGLIGFLFTLLLGLLMSLLASQLASSSADPDKSVSENFIEPWLLHPIVSCWAVETAQEEYKYEGRKSQMMASSSIEDEDAEAAEVANLMATQQQQQRRNSVARNGCELERRMSKVSKRSHRSSVGGGSNNSFHLGMMTTTTAEVLVNENPSTIEHLVLERRLSQISNKDDQVFTEIASRSPRRSGSTGTRRRSEMVNPAGAVVSVPMPSPNRASTTLLLAPPTREQLAQRRFSEVNAAIERHNMRKAAKRSQSVMYRSSRRKFTRAGAANNHGGDIIDVHELALNRKRSTVKL